MPAPDPQVPDPQSAPSARTLKRKLQRRRRAEKRRLLKLGLPLDSLHSYIPPPHVIGGRIKKDKLPEQGREQEDKLEDEDQQEAEIPTYSELEQAEYLLEENHEERFEEYKAANQIDSRGVAGNLAEQLEDEINTRQRKRLKLSPQLGLRRNSLADILALEDFPDTVSFDDQPDESCFIPPISGGEASRADGSFASSMSDVLGRYDSTEPTKISQMDHPIPSPATTLSTVSSPALSFSEPDANAAEYDSGKSAISSQFDSSPSLPASQPLPPPSPTISPTEPDEDSFPMESTQWYQDFVDSSQFRAMEQNATPILKPHLPQDTSFLNSSNSDGSAVKRLPGWNFDPKRVPRGSTRVYCVRRGYVPGFHFEEPYLPPLSQHNAFNDFRCERFDFDHKDVADVIAEANAYMNHIPETCQPNYLMCYSDCMESLELKREVELDEPSQQLRQECNSRASCPVKPNSKSVIDLCVRMFNLCSEQEDVLRLAASGRNVFYTGPAGTGKSQVLKAIVRYCHGKGLDVHVLSPTGLAALLVGGKTVHSYAGWTSNAERYSIEELEGFAGKRKTWKRLSNTKVLIIDEISMISNFTFSRLDRIMKRTKNAKKPFGGVQIIITGDFYQLPPVKPFKTCFECGKDMVRDRQRNLHACPDKHFEIEDRQKYAFCSPAWKDCRLANMELFQSHRHDDKDFYTLLNKIRLGHALSVEDEGRLLGAGKRVDENEAIRIYPFRQKVNTINQDRLDKLHGSEVRCNCTDGYRWNAELHPELEDRFGRMDESDETSCFRIYSGDERHRYDDVFHMKIDMPVILLTNLSQEEKLVNGSRGGIIGFEDYNENDLESPAGKVFREMNRHSDHAFYEASEIRTFMDRALDKRWPVVEFENGAVRTIHCHCEVEEVGIVHEEDSQHLFSLMSRTQIPLLAGWAITTHKSQGMSLDNAVVDPTGSWEPGSVYVALSRVRTLAGLKVLSLANGAASRASERVKEFMAMTFKARD